MKFLTPSIIVATFTLASLAIPAVASDIQLRGPANYILSNDIGYDPDGKRQDGRYSNLGDGYYSEGEVRTRWVINHSGHRTGWLACEFWALKFVDATSGPILLTGGVEPLEGGEVREFGADGWVRFLNRRRFPDINVWERTTKTKRWLFRDAITFNRKDLL
ncbi:MAG: hypothetical protein V4733_10925 [Verrucomicrobiota bacterium]